MTEHLSPLTDDELAHIRGNFIPPGYPPYEDRLVIPRADLLRMVAEGRIVIPDGDRYHIAKHPNRRIPETKAYLDPIATVESPLGPEYTSRWQELGLFFDTANRPLHPRLLELLPTIGMCTGLGSFYRYGPQQIGNLALRRERNRVVEYAVVAVERGRRLRWGLPGGYTEPDESSQDAAFREAWEEATIELGTELQRRALGHLVITGQTDRIKCTPVDTAHSWMVENYIFVRSPDNAALEGITLRQGTDPAVVAVQWMDLNTIHNTNAFLSSHRRMIQANEESLI